MKTRALILCAALIAACTHSPEKKADQAPSASPAADAGVTLAEAASQKLPGEDVLATRPQPPPLSTFDAPVPQVRTLKNGLKLYVVHRPESAIEAIQLVVKRGASSDPDKLPGVASLAAEMLEAGSAGKSQAEIARAVDALGGSLAVGAGQDATNIAMSALATQLQPMAQLLADVALRPNLDPAEWKKLQAQRTAELLAARARPETAAELAFKSAIYGKHPLGRPAAGTPESVKAMQLSQVKRFLATFSPKDAALIAVGGANADDVAAVLEKAFGGWKAPRTALAAARTQEVPAERPRLVVVDFPGRPQSVVRIGQPSVPRSSPDYLALEVMNTILGGSFTSRLNANLREKNGFTYGAFSTFAYGQGPGPFLVLTNVKTEVTGPALREALSEVRQVVEQPLSPEDLDKGKALLAADLVRDLETSESTAGAIAAIFLYDLPVDEYRTFVDRLKALTSEQVQAATRRALQPDRFTIAIVGDVAKVQAQLQQEEALKHLPAAQQRNAEGQVVR